jgi:hypothetical protein
LVYSSAVERGDPIQMCCNGITFTGRIEELFRPPSDLLALRGFDTAEIREALRDPEIERAALISGTHDRRENVFVALQHYSGQWHELGGLVEIIPGHEDLVWPARRRKKTQRAIQVLAKSDECQTPKVEAAIRDISEFIVEYLPLSATNLSRGYRLVVNMDGQRSISLDGVLFDPTAGEPRPSTAAIGRLKADLATGWLSELAASWPELPRLITSPDVPVEQRVPRERSTKRLNIGMEHPFYVERNPAPDGTLEAFNEGRTLCDASGLGYLLRFLFKEHLLAEADIKESHTQDPLNPNSGKRVICATKQHVR